MTKQSRKELIKQDDAFLTAAGEGAAWVKSHRRQVIAGAIGAVAIIAAVWGAVEYLRARDHKASSLFAAGWRVLNAEVLPEGATTAAQPEGNPPTFATEKDKWTAARARFEEVVGETGRSGVGVLSQFIVADLHEKLGETDKAKSLFKELADDLPRDDNLNFLAVERLAYLHEAAGDKDAAIAILEDLAGKDKTFYGDYAAYHQARLYLEKGETERARNLLEHVEKTYPTSSVLDAVKAKLDEIGRTPGKDVALAGDKAPTAKEEKANP